MFDTCDDEDEMDRLMNELDHYEKEIHEEDQWHA
jgi:hypothetical protein